MRILSLLIGLLLPTAARAELNMDYGGMYERICNTLPFCDRGTDLFPQVGMAVISVILPLTGVAAIASFAVAGLKMVTEGEEGMSSAKKIILTTMVGVFLALGAYGIMVYLNNQVLQDVMH